MEVCGWRFGGSELYDKADSLDGIVSKKVDIPDIISSSQDLSYFVENIAEQIYHAEQILAENQLQAIYIMWQFGW